MESLSAAIHDVGTSLTHLNMWANEKEPDCIEMAAKHAVFDTSQIQRRLRGGIRGLLDRCGFIYAGANAGSISVCGRSYASAHQAVVGEAIGLLTLLWISLDLESYQHLRAATPERWKLPSRREELQKLNDGTGFDPKCISSGWDESRAIICSVLTDDWMRDFKPLIHQLQRERAWAVANNMPAPSSFLSPVETHKPAGEPLGTQLPLLPRVDVAQIPSDLRSKPLTAAEVCRFMGLASTNPSKTIASADIVHERLGKKYIVNLNQIQGAFRHKATVSGDSGPSIR